MLEVQKYLQTHTLVDLANEYGIQVVEYDDCVLLSYSQIESPKTHPIVIECRGLILSKDYTEIYCKSFDRFFNYGELVELQGDFSFDTSVVSEKVDGSIIRVYYHPLRGWCVSTRKNAFSDNLTPMATETFEEAFYKAVGDKTKFFEVLESHRDKVFVFEFVSPQNRVVKNYGNGYYAYLLSVFEQKSGKEITTPDSIEEWKNVFGVFENIRFPKLYPLSSYEDICHEFETMEETDEGFVLYDTVSKIRVKMKNPSYLKIFARRINGVLTERIIVEMVTENETAEYLTYFESDRPLVEPYIEAYEKLCTDIEYIYGRYGNIEEQKKFAMVANQYPFNMVLFKMRKGVSLGEAINSLSTDVKCRLIGKYLNT